MRRRRSDLTPTHMFFKNIALCWSRYQDTNPIPTSSLEDDLATASSRPVAPVMVCETKFPRILQEEIARGVYYV